MLNKLRLGFIIVFLLGLFFILAVSLTGQELLPQRNITAEGANLVSAVFRPACNLPDLIEVGKSILETSPPLEVIEKEHKIKLRNRKLKINYQLIRKQITLAILDTDDCNIFTKTYWIDEDGIQKGNYLRKIRQENPGDIPKFMPVDPDNDFAVIVNWWNNHNSELSVIQSGSSESERYVVVGNKFSLSNDNIVFPAEITGLRYSDIVYVPFSYSIYNADLDESGRQFMSRNVDEVAVELDDLGIESRAYPGKLVTETITPEFVKNILITEQVDPSLLFVSDDNGRMLAGRVFVRYATNGEKAFRYTFSRTEAAGAGQIMAGTYATVPRAYPGASLIKDIDIGRMDLKNGIKATFLILDMKLAEIEAKVQSSSKAKKVWASKTRGQKLEAIAASYNGGSSKYKHLTGTISLAVQETVDFVRKYKMITDLNLFK